VPAGQLPWKLPYAFGAFFFFCTGEISSKKNLEKKKQVIFECFKEFGEKRKKKKQAKIAKFLYSVFNV